MPEYGFHKLRHRDKEEDMRMKVCAICKRKRKIHKHDAYCSGSCRTIAQNRLRGLGMLNVYK